jgi:hypothetical protein
VSGSGASGGAPDPDYSTHNGSPGLDGIGGGVVGSLVSIENTIVGRNVSSSLPDHDVWGQFASLGHNLISTATGDYGPGFNSNLGDLLNIDPGLAALGDYGGPPLTHALLDNSPAVDSGDNSAVSGSGADQRGLPRIVGGAVDIGAYEFQGGPPCISSITPLPGWILLLRCAGTSGAAYTLQTSTNLSDWVDLTSMSAGPDGRIEFQVGHTNHAEFFRLRSP